MAASVRVKVASVLLATTAVVGVGVGMSGQAQAAGGRSVYGTWVNGYLGDYYYESPRPWDWGYAYGQCRGYHGNTRSVKLLTTEDEGAELFKYRYACSNAARP